ncbi:MAG: radical SAM protein [Candidatus Woesearchaeota archaeon]
MRITFINPTLGGDYSALDIAITTLATIINKKSHHLARILDFTFHKRTWREKLKKHIHEFKPNIIGFSTNSLYFKYIIKISEEIKKLNPNIKIIIGGYYATTNPQIIRNSLFDYLFVGDADETIVEFLNKLEKKKELRNIRGLWYYEEDGTLIHNAGYFYENLDDLPYLDWDLWEDLDKYFYFLGMLYFIGSRGCIYNCSFCEAREFANAVDPKRYYRKMSPKRFAEELAYQWKKYENRGLRLIQVFDQIPTLEENWIIEFCEHYKKIANINKHKYSMFSRADNLNEKKIKLLKEAGCNMLRIGFEHGDEEIRNKILRKGLSDEKIEEVSTLLKKYRMKSTSYYILGVPGETKKSILKTIKLAKKINSERSAFFIFKPLTNESVKIIEKTGSKMVLNRLNKADNITFKAILKSNDLSAWEIDFFQIYAYLLTFLPRLTKTIKRKPIRYWIELITYLMKGITYGLSLNYLVTYYHIYGYDNIFY